MSFSENREFISVTVNRRLFEKVSDGIQSYKREPELLIGSSSGSNAEPSGHPLIGFPSLQSARDTHPVHLSRSICLVIGWTNSALDPDPFMWNIEMETSISLFSRMLLHSPLF